MSKDKEPDECKSIRNSNEQNKDDCKWPIWMVEFQQNTTGVPEKSMDKYIPQADNCTIDTCMTRQQVMDKAVCKAFQLYPKLTEKEAIFYAETFRIYNQTADVDRYNLDYIAQYLFLVLPRNPKFIKKPILKDQVKMLSVAVPVKKGETPFSMKNCALDYVYPSTKKYFKFGYPIDQCNRNIDFQNISIHYISAEQRVEEWKQRDEQTSESLESQSYFS